MPFFTDVELSDSAGGPPIPARTLEISLGGVGLMSPKPLPEGSHIRLIFHLRNGSQTEVPETVHGMVRVLRSDIDGHRLGIEFSEPLRPDHNPKLLKKVESL
jgi:c-di-GMP-binding flagellar brake protein YcgR